MGAGVSGARGPKTPHQRKGKRTASLNGGWGFLFLCSLYGLRVPSSFLGGSFGFLLFVFLSSFCWMCYLRELCLWWFVRMSECSCWELVWDCTGQWIFFFSSPLFHFQTRCTHHGSCSRQSSISLRVAGTSLWISCLVICRVFAQLLNGASIGQAALTRPVLQPSSQVCNELLLFCCCCFIVKDSDLGCLLFGWFFPVLGISCGWR